MSELLTQLTDWYMMNINYGTITALMAVESSFIPFPSEIVVPPAAWKAAQGELNIFLVLLFSTAGAILGAIFNYYFAHFLGRRLIYNFLQTRFAAILLLDEAKMAKSEAFFRKHGRLSTFIGRLVPGIRQLISLPAGFARMNIPSFLLYSTLGSGLWNIILILLGYFLFTQKELLQSYYDAFSYAAIGLGLVFMVILLAKGLTRKKLKTEPVYIERVEHSSHLQ